MKKVIISILMMAVAFNAVAASDAASKAEKKEAVKAAVNDHLKFYGFIRNYFSYDSRACKAGTGDLFMHLPMDVKEGTSGQDINAVGSYHFLAFTSRFGLDVKGFSAGNWDFGAKLEADFYTFNSSSNTTAQFRLRQAFLTAKWNGGLTFKMGQAWHPMFDLPPITGLDAGAPFNPFSRTPLAMMSYDVKGFGLDAAYIYQMQYKSAGPNGSSYDYVAHGGFEFFLALRAKTEHTTFKVGADVLSIKPRWVDAESGQKLNDRITTVSPMVLFTASVKGFSMSAKAVYHQAGEHVSLLGGYALCDTSDPLNYKYTPTHGVTANLWFSQDLGKGVKAVLFGGYSKNFGTMADCSDPASKLWFNSNAEGYIGGTKVNGNLTQAFRGSASIIYKPWKFFEVGLEYSATGATFGDFGSSLRFLATENLRTVVNHRAELLVRFSW